MTRVEVLGQAASTKRATLHCPCCGAIDTSRQYKTGDNETEYFYYLAEAIGLIPTAQSAALTKAIYQTWDTIKYPRFLDYVAAIDEEGDEPS